MPCDHAVQLHYEAKPCTFLQALFDAPTTQRGVETEGGPKAGVSLTTTQEKVLVLGSVSLHTPWMHFIGLPINVRCLYAGTTRGAARAQPDTLRNAGNQGPAAAVAVTLIAAPSRAQSEASLPRRKCCLKRRSNSRIPGTSLPMHGWPLGVTSSIGCPCCRRLVELEAKLVDEETERRIKELIEDRVQEIMNSDSVQQSLHARLEEERQALEEQV